MRSVALLAVSLLVAGCSSGEAPLGEEREDVGRTAEPLTAECTADVQGSGTLDVETQYLPNVVHCENGGAPLEALKAQAIAARTFLYYKLETSGSIGDGQGDQVYSCGSTATAEQKQAVLDTAGIVLRYKGNTICSFFVAGGAASPPACKGGSASTEPDVTYNQGLSGADVHQSPLGFVSPTNYRNRGCMSQLGSRCLADEGKGYEEILKFYYGADIVLEQATGPCVPAKAADAGAPSSGDAGATQHTGTSTSGATTEDSGTSSPETAGTRGSMADTSGCGVAPGARGPAPFALVALAMLVRRRRRQG